MSDPNTLHINGNPFSFNPGETILDVARQNDIDLPTLCHLKGAVPTGACRICVVEVEGARTLLPSCTTPAVNNMVVQTESPSVIGARKVIIQLLLSSGNHNCAIRGSDDQDWTQFQLSVQSYDGSDDLCPVWGDCRLQDLAYRYQVSGDSFPGTESRYPMETVNPFIVRDFSRCIQCGRCVQACNEIQVNNAIHFGYRGSTAKIVAAGDRPLKDSDCVFCGECVQVCPVGALVEKDVRYKVRPWENRKIRTTCGYCGVGCQLYLHVRDNRVVQVTGVEYVAPNYGSLCAKGRFGYDYINSPDRLTVPLIKDNGRLREATWDEALDLIAGQLNSIRAATGPDSIGILTSASISNEENYLASKFARAVLKTNNIDHFARLCHSPSVAGLTAAFGCGEMTNTIGDIEDSEVVLVTGSNTTETHPVLSRHIKRAVSLKNAKLLLVDPRRIKLVHFAHRWLRQQLGTDVAWINGMIHVIITEGLYDKEFVESRTDGFDGLKKTVEKYTPEYAETISGIPAKQLTEAARLYAAADAATIVCGLGITQQTSGTDSIKALANLAMLCGHIGIRGGGLNPLQGQNNAQGALDMGARPDVYSGYQAVTDETSRKKMAAAWGVPDLPVSDGMTVNRMISKAHSGDLKALYVIGENPLAVDPDPDPIRQSLKNLALLIVQDIFLTETAKLADVVLPSSCFAEKNGTFTNTERRVQRIRKAIDPPGQARDDWRIICDVSTRMGYSMSYDGPPAIMEEIRTVTPSYAGIAYDRIKEEGIHQPCLGEAHCGTPILHQESFVGGKGRFHPVEFVPPQTVTDAEYPLYLTVGRELYHFHTGTRTMKSAGLNERAPEFFAEIAPADAIEYDLQDGSVVEIASRWGKMKSRIKVSPKTAPGMVFIPSHVAPAATLKLTRDDLTSFPAIPESKVCAVKLTRAT
jgi:formate dehydrogenase alpha subunit